MKSILLAQYFTTSRGKIIELANKHAFSNCGEDQIIEHCQFNLADGKLIPTECWYKNKIGDRLTGRKKCEASGAFCKEYASYDSAKIVITNETEERITHNIFTPQSLERRTN